MNSSLRAVLLIALGLGIAGAIFLGSRSAPKPAKNAPTPAPSLDEAARVAPEPNKPATADPVISPAPTAVAPGAPADSVAENSTADSMAAAMHALEDSAPERALALAQRGQALWPAGPRAAEFAATEVKCLYRLGRPSEGRGTAEAMVNQYPTSPWALEVERQTGAHPYVNH